MPKISELPAGTTLDGDELVPVVQNGVTVYVPSSYFSIERLLANRTYYVRTDGADSNDGLSNTSSGAFATIQKALNVCGSSIDLNGFQVVIQVGAGTYGTYTANAVNFVNVRGYRTVGDCVLRGDTSTPSNVTLNFNTSSFPIEAHSIETCWQIEGFRIDNSGNLFTIGVISANLQLASLEIYGSRTFPDILAQSGAVIKIYGQINRINGGSSRALLLASQWSFIECINTQVQWTGTATTYTVGGLYATDNSAIRFTNNTFNATTFTGPKGAAYSGSILEAQTDIPGSTGFSGDGTGKHGASSIAAIFVGATHTFAGKVASTGPTSGVGYATGAGGTVTQGTNKSTGVTINTVSGQITMNNATLNAGAEVGFTVTNSAVAATDVVIVNIASGATPDSYHTEVDAVGAGSFRVSLTNVSGSNLGEALVLNFAVIKGVTS